MSRPAPLVQPDNLKAILWMVAAAASFTGLVVSVRELSDSLPAAEILFLRSLFSTALLLPWLARAGWSGIATRRPVAHLVRSSATFTAMMLWFHAIGITTLATAVAIQSTYPLFTILLAAILLRERPRALRWAATAAGFGGMLIIVRPGMIPLGPATLMLLAAAVFYAISNVSIKWLADTESANRLVFIQNAALTVLAAAPALWGWVDPPMAELPWLAVLVIAGLAAHMCLTRAMSLGDASLVMPFDYLRLPFAAILGFFLYLEVPDGPTILGGLVIVAAASVIAATERRGGRVRGR